MYGNVISIYDCVSAHFFLLVGVIVSDFIIYRRITLIQIWNVAFIYVIWAEMIKKSVMFYSDMYMNAISFLLIANDLVLLGYLMKKTQCNSNISNNKTAWLLINPKGFFVSIVGLLILYLVSHYMSVVNSMGSGRSMGNVMGNSINVMGVFSNAAGLMVSAMAAFYFRWNSKYSKWWSVLFLFPVVLFQLFLGTRFRLLYMVLPWLILVGIINVKHQKTKSLAIIFVAAVAISSISSFVKENRYGNLLDAIDEMAMNEDSSNSRKGNLFLWLASKMSSEGCVQMTYLAEDWFSTHDHEYGKEIGFMFYWVIPRAIWKDKPTPVDHWLIREYEIVSDKHSSASGFTGEIRADFGYWCLILVYLFGRFLKRADNYVEKSFNDETPYLDKILAALIYPCVFFSVRSPLTATQSFFVEILILWAIAKLLGRKCEVQTV